MIKSKFLRPLKVYDAKGLEILDRHPNITYVANGRALHSLFYDSCEYQQSPHYEFVTDSAEAEVLSCDFCNNLEDYRPNIRSIIKDFPNLKLIIMTEVFHIGESMTRDRRAIMEERIQEVNIDPDLPLMMAITMDSHYVQTRRTHLRNIAYSDYILNTMVMLYKDQPRILFDQHLDQGVHWWVNYRDNDTLGLRRQNYALHDLRDLPDWNHIIHSVGVGGVPKLYVSPSRSRDSEKFFRHLTAYKDWNSFDRNEVQTHGQGFGTRDYLRHELQSLLSYYPGFLGNGSLHNFLVGEGVTPMQLANSISNMEMPGNVPLNNEYYRHSVLTINVETLTLSGSYTPRCVTEKTFELILKGHFPLTFAYQGFYEDLRSKYDIILPEWIDYSFDGQTDNLRRWVEFKLEVTRVLNLGAKQLFEYRNNQIDDLSHNRSVLLNQGLRHPIHEAIGDFLEQCRNLPENPVTNNFINDIIG